MSDNAVTTLMNLIGAEYEIGKAISILQMITKKKSGDASQLAKQALQDLKTVIQNAETFGVSVSNCFFFCKSVYALQFIAFIIQKRFCNYRLLFFEVYLNFINWFLT